MGGNGGDGMFEKQRRKRNVALAVGLGLLVLLFFAMTIVRMGGQG